MRSETRICLISPGHLGSNPRLAKEADALSQAGYSVHVISGDTHPAARFRDASILKQVTWASDIVPVNRAPQANLQRRLIRTACRWLFSAGWWTVPITARAHHALTSELASTAIRVHADLYIGHCLAALPAAVWAGTRHRARIGFDAEDFHSGEAADADGGRRENAIARFLEASLLPRCQHLTASSPLIAEAYRDRYGVEPTVILNVFPLSEAVEPKPPPQIPAFYWFSQTIGPGRGIEEFIEIARQLNRPVRLDLRGHVTESYHLRLEALAQGTSIELRLLEPDVPRSMVQDATGYTAGLALERREPLNRDLCLTNKAFTYLLAGVPVILSRTQAQERLAAELGSAALLIDLEKPLAATRKLSDWLGKGETFVEAQNRAIELGRSRYNWDREKALFLRQVQAKLNSQSSSSLTSCSPT